MFTACVFTMANLGSSHMQQSPYGVMIAVYRGGGTMPSADLQTRASAARVPSTSTGRASPSPVVTVPNQGQAVMVAEPGSRSVSRRCDRSRDRSGTLPIPPGQYRFTAAGTQETADWLGALETVNTRPDALERLTRNVGQSMASLEKQVGHIRQATETCHDTVQKTTSEIDTMKVLREPGDKR